MSAPSNGGSSNSSGQETTPSPTLSFANPTEVSPASGNSGNNVPEVATNDNSNASANTEGAPAVQNVGLLGSIGNLLGFGGSPWSSLLFWLVVLLAVYLTYRRITKRKQR